MFPYYSSYIGNIQYDYFDPINSSIEIGRRGYETMILKNKQFYPPYLLKDGLIYQWKEHIKSITGWKELFSIIKNLKLRYRVSLGENKHLYNVLRMGSIKSGILLYDFV